MSFVDMLAIVFFLAFGVYAIRFFFLYERDRKSRLDRQRRIKEKHAAQVRIRIAREKRRYEKMTKGMVMIERAKQAGVKFVINDKIGECAICKAKDFLYEEDFFLQEIKAELPAETRMNFQVCGTFIFWKPNCEYRHALQVGPEIILHQLLKEAVENITAISADHVLPEQFQQAKRLIVQYDKRLFVPFTAPEREIEHQHELLGGTSLQEAKDYLLSDLS